MKFCNKCGAQLADELKLCDKCGAAVEPNPEEIQSTPDIAESEKPIAEPASQAEPKAVSIKAITPDNIKDKLLELINQYIPASLLQSKPDFMAYLGFGCMALVAIVYLICMYIYIPDICWPIGKSAELGGAGAGAVWMYLYFIINLIPAVFALWPLKIKSFRKYSMLCAAGIFVMTLFSLICWALCEPANVYEAMVIYPLQSSFNTQAWFSFMDCLSEAWYLKLILSLGAVFGYGVDYLVNKSK